MARLKFHASFDGADKNKEGRAHNHNNQKGEAVDHRVLFENDLRLFVSDGDEHIHD